MIWRNNWLIKLFCLIGLYFLVTAFVVAVFQWPSCLQLFVTHGLQHARLSCPSLSPGVCSNSCPLSWLYHPVISSSVSLFSSCPQSFPASGCFPMSHFLHQVGKVLEFQFQHQSFQWIFRTDFLYDWLVWFPCSPRDSQQSSPAP